MTRIEPHVHLSDADLDRLASAAFEWDRANGHHKGGPWTWHMLPEPGRQNYRDLVTAVLTELEAIRAAS